jgi:signal peptidase
MGRLVTAAVALALAAAALGHAPVSVHYATSDSMEPTLGAGDVFLVVHGEVEVGDVALFHAPGREGLVTHRVVDETDDGYLTRGDANPSTDQAAGAPPVAPDEVVGRVATVGGAPLALSGAGPVVAAVAANRGLVAGGLAVVLVGLLSVDRRDDRDPRADLTTARAFFRPFLAMAAALMVTVVVVGAATAPVAVVHVADPAVAADEPAVVPTGEAARVSVPVETDRPPFTYHVVRAEGLSLSGYERTPTGVETTVAVEPRERPGTTSGTIRVYTYPAVLPRSVVAPLHAVHPVVGAGATALAMLVPPLALYALAFDPRELFRDGGREVRR